VQGVNFRFYAKAKADELGIKGFVRNEPDSSVYIEAEGESYAIGKFIKWCKDGPSTARVESIKIKEGNTHNFSYFKIK